MLHSVSVDGPRRAPRGVGRLVAVHRTVGGFSLAGIAWPPPPDVSRYVVRPKTGPKKPPVDVGGNAMKGATKLRNEVCSAHRSAAMRSSTVGCNKRSALHRLWFNQAAQLH